MPETRLIRKNERKPQKIKDKLSGVDSEIAKMMAKRKKQHKVPEKIEVGDSVYIISFDQHGTVISPMDENKNVMVQMGLMKIKVPLNELVIDEMAQNANSAKNNSSGTRNVSGKRLLARVCL